MDKTESKSIYCFTPSLLKFSSEEIAEYMGKNREKRIKTTIKFTKEERQNRFMDNCRSIILDDGPTPMRDMQKTNINPNAVDRLTEEHRGEHDKLSEQTRDRMEEVHQHNETYPKMREGLRRRKSLLRIAKKSTNSKFRRRPNITNSYDHVVRIRRRKNNQIRKKSSPRYQRGRRGKVRNSAILVSLGCQCGVTLVDKLCSVANFKQKRNVAKERKRRYGRERKKGRNIRNKSDASMSSYNSFTSIDHEPML